MPKLICGSSFPAVRKSFDLLDFVLTYGEKDLTLRKGSRGLLGKPTLASNAVSTDYITGISPSIDLQMNHS